MRLSLFTDYSLRLLIYLSIAPEQRATIATVASAYDISEHHMVKVVHLLGQHGYLENTRGRHGGVRLARPPAEINLGEVVRLTEGGDVLAECFDRERNQCVITPACRLQGALRGALEAFYEALGRHTMADIVTNPERLGALLGTPPER